MYEDIRYPFVITDDAGYEVLSYPSLKENNECFFSGDNFSPEELSFLYRRIRECRFGNLIVLKESKNGNAVFVSPFSFASTRTLIAVISDINYDIVASICTFSFSDVILNKKSEVSPKKEYEKSYDDVSNILYYLNQATDYYSYVGDFCKYLESMVEAISHMTFCKVTVNFESRYLMRCFENFDSGIFALYLFVMMSIASFASPNRNAELNFCVKDDLLLVSFSFPAFMDKAFFDGLEKRFSNAVAKLDSICAENNLPVYFYRDGVFKSGIIPCRIENDCIGLKARRGFLKDKQQKEQKERNIFLFTSPSADE